MENRSIAAEPAKGKAENIQRPMLIQRNAEKKSYVPMKNAAVCVDLSVLIAGLTPYGDRLDKKKPRSCQR
jgi:hypothetical protein